MCIFKKAHKAHLDSNAFLHGCQSAKNRGNLLLKATIFKYFKKIGQFSIDNGACFAYIVLSTWMCKAQKRKDGDEHEVSQIRMHRAHVQ